jgi:DNA modification methylase
MSNKYYIDEQGFKIQSESVGCFETVKVFGDVFEELPKLKEKFDLILTDPPYNIGWKYSNKVNDRKKDYNKWCEDWANDSINKLTDNGVFGIINYPENNNILYNYLIERKDLNFIQQIIWCYPTNVGHSKCKYTRSYRTILLFSKGKNYTFNALKQPYKNPTDKRIKERIAKGHLGTNLYDVWNINLCKNISKDKKQNGINQLPRELCERLIKTFSKPYDNVLDIFAGNFTIPIIATKLNRCGFGIDINNYEDLKHKNK